MAEAARAMSREDAFAELQKLDGDGVIVLERDMPMGPQQVSLDGWDPSTQSPLDGCVAGVVIRYLESGHARPILENGETVGWTTDAAGGSAPNLLDPRNALALVRLCQWLSETYGITELYHLGIAGGGVDAHGNPRTDCHGQGRAVDFVGVLVPTEDGGTVPYTVQDDWGTAVTAVTPGGDWPAGTGSHTSYRLDDPDADEWARDFFRSFYEFAAGQWQDRTSGPDPDDGTTTGPGADSVFLMHPDHPSDAPDPHGRHAHRNHVHMQIGVTGTA